MKAKTALNLGIKYEICPECGNKHVGGGEGTVIIEGNSFVRTCKCGWKVKVDVKEGE